MKFDFRNSTYNKMWDSTEGRTILSYVVKDIAEQYIEPVYFPTAFRINPSPIPTDQNGVAAFRVNAVSPERATMMDARAPLGEGRLVEGGEAFSYTGSITDFISPVWKETAAERKYKADLFASLDDDAAAVKAFAENVVAPQIKSGYMALDYMAQMAESTGKVVYDKGRGIKTNIYKADIPAENFQKFGDKVATDADAKIITTLVEIEEKYRNLFGIATPMQWKMTKKFFSNVFLKNKEVQEQIKIYWLIEKGISSLDTSKVPNYIITEENFNKYVVPNIDGLSPIKIVPNIQVDNGSLVSGWKDGIITLSPAGYAGEILTSNILDVSMYASDMTNDAVAVTSTSAANGLMTVINMVTPNGMFKDYLTKVVMAAVPVLTDFRYRVIVDTTQTGTI